MAFVATMLTLHEVRREFSEDSTTSTSIAR